MKLNQYQLMTMGILGLTACTGVILASSTTFADNDSTTDEITISVPTTCTMSGSGQTSHNATLLPGTYSGASGSEYESGIGSTTLTTYCNDNNGFSIYAIGFTNDTPGSNVLQGTSASGNATIASAVYDSSSPNTSSWSMKVAAGRDSGDTTTPTNLTIDNGFNNYHVVPDDTTGYIRVAHKSANTDMTENTGGATITTTYDAYISTIQPADTYTGKVKYVMVHPYVQSEATDPNKPLASNVTPPESCPNPVQGLTYMQDLNSSNKASILTNMTEDAQYYLADKRDDKAYCVAKLKDGNIWMTQNLDHDIVTDGTVTYDSTTTDLPANTTWIPERATYASNADHWNDYDDSDQDNPTGVNGEISPESYDPGNLYWDSSKWLGNQSSCEAAGGTWNNYGPECRNISISDVTTSAGNSHHHLGNYYNASAALAMNDTSNVTEEEDFIVEQSICPAGWTLPRVGTGEDTFEALLAEYQYVAYSSPFIDENNDGIYNQNENAIWTNPLYFSFSGHLGSYHGDGSLHLDSVGKGARYASSVIGIYDGDYITKTTFTPSFQSVGYDYYPDPRAKGISIRCIARPVATTIEFNW